jgi:cytochrome c-type biogenesis protein CcmH/NrfG
MKGTKRQNPFPPPKRERAKSESDAEQVADLVSRMIEKAKRDAEAERVRAKSRGPLTRLLLALTIIAAVCAAATGIYGVWNFPDAPLRFRDGGYVGKTGKAHTQAEYEAYTAWKGVLLIVFPSAFILGFAFALADSRSRRK